MKIMTLKSTFWVKATFLFFGVFLNFSLKQASPIGGNLNAQQVLLDSHSAANGNKNWTITTNYPNELIIISAGGYGTNGNTLSTVAGTVTVNGNNATFIKRGLWLDRNFSWQECIWAYVAPTVGTYSCACTEATLNSPWYFNFASSVYQPNCPTGLDLGNIIAGGSDSNHGPTTISASITTTENGSWIYGSIDNNDNGHTGIVKWNGQLTETNFTYINNGVDGDQADSTYANSGTYTITSTDLGASNVWMTICLIAVQPNLSCCALTAAATPTGKILCFGDNTAGAYATPGKGHAPYTYSWAPGGQTTDSITGLSAGTYTVIISDTIDCSATATVTITQPDQITTIQSIKNVLCNGGTGSDSIITSGGTSPYTYSWKPGGNTTASVKGLSVGSYTVSIKDINGCTGSAGVTITQPTQLTASIGTPVNPSCNGGSGTATASGTGGTSPYTYRWSPGGQTNANATGLSAGTYTVSIKDNNGCSATASVTITQPAAIQATTVINAYPPCNGQMGSATVTASVGPPPYTYLWNPSAQTTATATGLTAGAYTITVSDANGCSVTNGVIITQPAVLTATVSQVNILCNGGTGSASVTAGGGTSPYTYTWSPSGQTSTTATGLTPATYTITIKDINGCVATNTVPITQPAVLTAAVSNVSIQCHGGTSTATVTPAGGTIPYTYSWAPSAQTTATATGLSAGTYTITLSDLHGCTTTNTTTITQPVAIAITPTNINNVPCNGGIGSATVNAAGGSVPYTYSWSPSAQTTATASNLSAGIYTVSVTDNNHCSSSTTVTITQPIQLTASIGSVTNVSCNNGSDGAATVTGNGGTTPYAYLWNPGGNTNAHATGLFALTYTATITDTHGCKANASITLTEPPALIVAISEPKIICKDSTGNLYANVSGGTAPYRYNWSSGGTTGTATITPISTNDYSVVVTDINGCTASANIVLQYGPQFSVSISGKNSVCAGDSTTICAHATGAIEGVNYLWTPQNNTNNCITVVPGLTSVYTVTVVDGCGATTTAFAKIYTDPIPLANMTANFYQGCMPFCIQFKNETTITSGSIKQYTWATGNGDTLRSANPQYCYTSSGTYNVTLTVVSDSGCSSSRTKVDMMTVYSSPRAAFTYSPQPVTMLTPTVQFTDESKDAYGIAYHWWYFGDNSDSTSNLGNPTHTYQDTGTYCANLIVMNNHGCSDTVTNCLVVGPAFTLYIPSAFSPNGNGVNETFKPVGEYVKNFEMYIFDRWGLELYHSTDINRGWDGTVHGGAAIEDTYIYKITIMDSQGTLHAYIGNITLLK